MVLWLEICSLSLSGADGGHEELGSHVLRGRTELRVITDYICTLPVLNRVIVQRLLSLMIEKEWKIPIPTGEIHVHSLFCNLKYEFNTHTPRWLPVGSILAQDGKRFCRLVSRHLEADQSIGRIMEFFHSPRA